MIPQIQMWIVWLITALILVLAIETSWSESANPIAKDGCQDRCGDVRVPYPFGLNSSNNIDCAINRYFRLNCTQGADGGYKLFLAGDIPVRNISLTGTITVSMAAAYDCYNSAGDLTKSSTRSSLSLNSNDTFTFSDTDNVFTVIGCDTGATVANYEMTFGAGCISLCTDNVEMYDNNTCSGTGCCQTTIPKGLRSLNMSIGSFHKHVNVSQFNPCGYAFLAERNSLKLSQWPLSRVNLTKVDLVLEWAPKPSQTCPHQAEETVCGSNTTCYYSDNAEGYRCLCMPGFQGNPYLPNGCQDIDECKDREKYPCYGTCHNTVGNYTCSCPLGMMYGDAKTGCHGVTIQTIFLVAAAVVGVLLLLAFSWRAYNVMIDRKNIELKRKHFKRNGGLLLQQHVSSTEGTVQKTKIFTSRELEAATDGFNENRVLGQGGQGTVYKGMLKDGGIVAVKKSTVLDESKLEGFINEVAILSQINHRNVVKLLGCCLETEVPLLVYEFIPNGNLFEYLHDPNEDFPLSWEVRLRIATEVAGALAYLHSAASIPVYHRDIKSSNILLDEKLRAKVSDFGTSKWMDIDRTHLTTDVKGTFGYLDPEYFRCGQFTAKSDVYSFGVVLVELLSGKKPILLANSQEIARGLADHFVFLMGENKIYDFLDDMVKEHSHEQEVIAVANLAKQCLHMSGKDRPTMREVIAELEKIWLSGNESNVKQETKEVENTTADVFHGWDVAPTLSTYGLDSSRTFSSDVDPHITNKTVRFS